MPRRAAGKPAGRFGTNGAIGRATRAGLASIDAGGLDGIRAALAIRAADAADTAAASGDHREFLAAGKLLEDVLGKLEGASGGRGDAGASGGSGPEREPDEPAGLAAVMGAGPSVGHDPDA